MARFEISGDDVRLALRRVERLEGVRFGDIAVPLSSVLEVRSVPSAWPELRGIRAPGTGRPGAVFVGTRRARFGRDFGAVDGQGPAVVVELDGGPFSRLVATVPDPDETTARILAGADR